MEHDCGSSKGEIMLTLKEYYCITHDAGPWSDDAIGSGGYPIVQTHRDLGCKIVESKDKPKLKGKENWGNTKIENELTNYMIKNYDRMLHTTIQSYKGPKKSQLIRGDL